MSFEILNILNKDMLALERWGFTEPESSYEGLGLDFRITCHQSIGLIKIHFDFTENNFYIYFLTEHHNLIDIVTDIDDDFLVSTITQKLESL